MKELLQQSLIVILNHWRLYFTSNRSNIVCETGNMLYESRLLANWLCKISGHFQKVSQNTVKILRRNLWSSIWKIYQEKYFWIYWDFLRIANLKNTENKSFLVIFLRLVFFIQSFLGNLFYSDLYHMWARALFMSWNWLRQRSLNEKNSQFYNSFGIPRKWRMLVKTFE